MDTCASALSRICPHYNEWEVQAELICIMLLCMIFVRVCTAGQGCIAPLFGPTDPSLSGVYLAKLQPKEGIVWGCSTREQIYPRGIQNDFL